MEIVFGEAYGRADNPTRVAEKEAAVYPPNFEYFAPATLDEALSTLERVGDEGKVLSDRKGRTVTDGPFVEGKEEVGGYLIVSAKDINEAVELARGCPILENNGTVEVRPIQHIPGL